MDDVPVEQDSAQKIAVFELQYMTAIAEAVKNWVGTKHMSKTDKRKELEAGCLKMVKERRAALKRYNNAQKKALAAARAAAAAAPPGPPPQQVAAAAPAALAEVAGADGGAIAMQQEEEEKTSSLPWHKRVAKEPHERWPTFAQGYDVCGQPNLIRWGYPLAKGFNATGQGNGGVHKLGSSMKWATRRTWKDTKGNTAYLIKDGACRDGEQKQEGSCALWLSKDTANPPGDFKLTSYVRCNMLEYARICSNTTRYAANIDRARSISSDATILRRYRQISADIARYSKGTHPLCSPACVSV